MFFTSIQQKMALKSRLSYFMVFIVFSLVTLGGFSFTTTDQAAARGQAIGLSQFQQLWDRSDKAVADGKVSRTFIWGPTISDLLTEPYTEGGSRQVQYFDKTRMEQTSGRSVSNGLLAKEMIAGLVQLGDNTFKPYPANTSINIAGDQGAATLPNPTYGSFRKVTTIDPKENLASDQTGQVLANTISQDGTTGYKAELGTSYNIRNGQFIKDTSHNVADVFWTFLNQSGTVYKDGAYSTDRIFDWVVAMGLPISEAYWSRAVVAGKEQDVLVQAFERRVLTYTPGNPEGYRVEMGNVGQHYYQWRQSLNLTATPTPAPTTTTPVATTPVTTTKAPITTTKPPTPKPTTPPPATNTPGTPAGTVPPPNLGGTSANWVSPIALGIINNNTQPLFNLAMKARPTDGVMYASGRSGSGTGSTGAASDAVLLDRYDGNGVTHLCADNGYSCDDSGYPVNQTNFRWPHLAFGSDGTGYLVYRFWPDPDYRGYMRKMNPDGTLQKGFDVGKAFANASGNYLDFPDVAVSRSSGKLYIVGNTEFSGSRGVGYGESTDGGQTWTNTFELTGGVDARGGFSGPHVCVDPNNDNTVHMVFVSQGNVYARSKINGVWQTSNYDAADHNTYNYQFRNSTTVACGSDGYAYAMWDSAVSFGLAVFNPTTGVWQTISNDMAPGQNTYNLASVVTPDNTLYIAAGFYYNLGDPPTGPGAAIFSSTNHGQSLTTEQTAVSNVGSASDGVGIDFTAINNRLIVAADFTDNRISKFSYETLPKK